MQLRSENGPVNGTGLGTIIQNNIIDGNASWVIQSYLNAIVRNNVIVQRSTASGSLVLWTKYRVA
ncbi:MAG: hypothetical protein QOI93_5493, partial [Rhodospirillaceae bacterium]|nr:hypothetical protein [Rhodospirillaceae bacterium]